MTAIVAEEGMIAWEKKIVEKNERKFKNQFLNRRSIVGGHGLRRTSNGTESVPGGQKPTKLEGAETRRRQSAVDSHR